MKGIIIFLILLQATAVHTDSHSLWAFATFITGETQFPEFSAVLMVDDIQVLYYNRSIQKLINRRQLSSDDGEFNVLEKGANVIFEDMYNNMKFESHQMIHRTNGSGGVHVYQRLAGCVLEKDQPSPVLEWDAYDGENARRYNMQNFTFLSPGQEYKLSKSHLEYVLKVFKTVYQPICIGVLKHYLKKEKNIVFRKERPRLRLLHTTCRDTGELRVSCLATGFYPRHINLTMLRDGLPIPEEELVLGGLLPNGDGTYQLRRTLRLSAEELGGGHHYTCSVTHLSLDNKLDISWEPGDGPNTTVIISVVVVVLALGLTSAIAACAICPQRSLKPVYSAAEVSEPEDSASHSSAN
ncbi:hypothetical protein AGOR_G00140920 [Albula goreensis]|uniref:Ig-like domain-containing protein n=1 Tax=Albula goreensis TaxID=1534307 RepID=A0A8T3DC48_9TELE|nr:hypothetical protein AGOR_G00140920 [Albula goreensis]